jgi:hypothetical protein
MPEQISNFTNSLWIGLTAAFTSVMNFIPNLFGAVILLAVGWYVSKLVGLVVEKVLGTIKFQKIIENARIVDYLPESERGTKIKLSAMLGGLAKWFVFLIFIQAAAITLGVEQINGIISSIILFIPNILVGIFILVLGAWAARFFSGMVEAATEKMNLNGPNIPALLVRYGILGFAVIAAIGQVGIATDLINIFFTGLVAFLAIAFGLAFGLGGRTVAAEMTRTWFEKGPYFNKSMAMKNENQDNRESETPMSH